MTRPSAEAVEAAARVFYYGWSFEPDEISAEDRAECLAETERALTAALPALRAQLRAEIEAEFETRAEFGHQTVELGWLPEHRGIKYATHQRTVHFRNDDPVAIDHWTYTDHRHPVEGCTAERHDLTTETALDAVRDRRSL